MSTILQEGDLAPDFSGTDQQGHPVSKASMAGKKLILFFYPQDDTPTCTTQACNLRDHYKLLQKKGFQLIGISPDTMQSHRKFREKYQLPFPLVADPDHHIINSYGVWGQKKLYGREYMGLHRTTFVIDETGKIIKIFRKPKNRTHAQEIMEKVT